MKNIDEFCRKRRITHQIQEAFTAYLRSDYALKFELHIDGDTNKMIVGKMSEDELENAWAGFVTELKRTIS